MDELKASTEIAVAGMKAQTHRLRVVAENLANADSLPRTPDGQPYRRKVVSFRNELDRELGIQTVHIDATRPDMSELPKKFDPKHPAADRDGYVSAPNVNPLIEMMDLREAQRSYDANLNVVNTSKAMLTRTIEMLR